MINKDKAECGLQENITFVSVNDKSIIPELRRRIKLGVDVDDLIETGKISAVYNKQNLIVDAGLSIIAQRLAGDGTYSLEINYGALGDGSASIIAGDTVMENELYRKLSSDSSFENKTAYVDFFFEKSDVAGTFTRFANFIDGTETKDTGIMWSEIPVNWTKTLNDGLFVSCRYRVYYKS